MNTESNNMAKSNRQPLPSLERTAIWTLGALVILSGITSLFSSTLIVFTLVALASLVLVARRIHWALLIGAFASAAIVVYILQNSAAAYLLLHPKDAFNSTTVSFALFAFIALDICCALAALIVCLAAFFQRDSQGARGRPGWVTPALSGMAGVFVGAILIAAMLPVGTSAGATNVNGMPTAHMALDSFVQSTVTVPKGSKLLLVEDVPSTHVLANGYWVNNAAHPATEAGAPSINNLQIKNGSIQIGPFNTAGTFHLYCVVHPGMNLTIIVQ
jgi:plastocyanin